MFNFFKSSAPKLTPEMVQAEEKALEDAKEQLALMRRYARAKGKRRVIEAETAFVWELGETVATEQVKAIQNRKIIKQARQTAKTLASAKIESYAQKLLGGGNE